MTWESIPAMVLSAHDRFGGAEAVVDGPLRLTFTELADRVRVAAGAFAEAGIGKGDRAAIWAPNSASTPTRLRSRASCWSIRPSRRPP